MLARIEVRVLDPRSDARLVLSRSGAALEVPGGGPTYVNSTSGNGLEVSGSDAPAGFCSKFNAELSRPRE
jgi:hypothetical protein